MAGKSIFWQVRILYQPRPNYLLNTDMKSSSRSIRDPPMISRIDRTVMTLDVCHVVETCKAYREWPGTPKSTRASCCFGDFDSSGQRRDLVAHAIVENGALMVFFGVWDGYLPFRGSEFDDGPWTLSF
jgi:hypothetical protein